jgi:ABC-type antimicrobial peptide transport system permease subunit
MFKNYLKIAWRSFAKNKISSFINIFGLAIGMAVAMLNGVWVWDELSFNQYHRNYDRIGQVMAIQNWEGQRRMNTSMSYPLALELKANYQGYFRHLVLCSWSGDYVLSAGQKNISGTGLFMDEGAPDMLSLRMLRGSPEGLRDPHSILLSASLARALFGDADPVSQVMRVSDTLLLKVTGVYEDIPLNSQFHPARFIAPFDCWVTANPWIRERAVTDWGNHFLRVYAEIPPTTSFEQVSARIKDIEKRHEASFTKGGFYDAQDFIYPMSKWHLYPPSRGVVDTAPVHMVWLVGTIGFIVLLLACINFMNLSTARSEKRAKEVGIRKTMGSPRWQLMGQFFSESFLVVLFAWLFAVALTALSLPWFNDLSAKQMTLPWANAYFWLISLLFILITGLLAGAYPALYLSSFQPVKVLRSAFRAGRLAALPRQTLVVLQFSISVILIICTVVVYRQIRHAKDRPVGYDREGLLMIDMKSPEFYGKYDLLRQELINTGAVTNMSESMGSVTTVWSNNGGFSWPGKNPNLKDDFGTLVVTSDHGATVGWQFLRGRDFSGKFTTDSTGIVMNEAAQQYMGLKDPVGQTISWKFWNGDTTRYYTILGVIKDMVMESPFEPVKPTIFLLKSVNGGVSWINIRISPNVSVAAALPKIQAVFKQLIPSAPFEYKFTDEEYARKFAAEERIGKLAAFFGSLAIFISCLGLFGLASFIAEKRTREIGIRKVLGASVPDVCRLLSKEFVQLVFLSCGVAIPAAWCIMHAWIQNYTYRTALSWWIFAAAGIGALVIALLTVTFQSLRAALMNPVDSLRRE